jgi:mannose-6-phosphate isomerase-like protein (cupin superfamily)
MLAARHRAIPKLEVYMRFIGIGLAFTLVAAVAVAVAQQPATPPAAPKVTTYTSSEDVQKMIAKASMERKEGQGIYPQRLLELAPYAVSLEYREFIAPAALHETEAEVFYVVQGAATMITGGKLVNQTRTNAHNLTGTAIEGGTERTVAPGDFIMVPENTPHWFSSLHGKFVVMTFHVPRPVVWDK